MTPFAQFNRLKQCRYGQLLYNEHDVYVGRSIELYGEYSEGEIEVFRQVVRPGDLVIEVGANIGAHTIYLAQQAGPTGCVIAFEPQRIVFQTLCANMALNSITNVHCFQQAVGAKPGQLIVPNIDYAQEGNFGGVALGGYNQGETVTITTLDSMNFNALRFIKIDVEGMEQTVLEGAVATIARHQPALYVENDRQEKSAALIRFIASLGYQMYWHRPPLFNPENFAGNAVNVFSRIVSLNMLCVPGGTQHNLQGFEPVQVPAG